MKFRDKTLLIISHTPHYEDQGVFRGWGATIREINFLAEHFRKVIHVAPLCAGSAHCSDREYEGGNIEFIKIPNAGGPRWIDKLNILMNMPHYLAVLLREMKKADIVHVRCPCSIGLISLVILMFVRGKKVWIKYAGDWSRKHEPLSNQIQKIMIRCNVFRGVATLNGKWEHQKEHMHSFVNPCMRESAILDANDKAWAKSFDGDVELLFVGRLEKTKGIYRNLEALKVLLEHYERARLTFVGEGEDRADLLREVERLGLKEHVVLTGALGTEKLSGYYQRAHFILLFSDGEGWPKVIGEAMAYGVLPLTSDVGCLAQVFHEIGVGDCFAKGKYREVANRMKELLDDSQSWQRNVRKAAAASRMFSYERYLKNLESIL